MRPLRLLISVLVMLGIVLSIATADAARKKKRVRHYRAPEPYVEKFAAVVVDANSGRVLHERMSNDTRYPASLTKMMTLYMLFEQINRGNISLSTRLTASAYAASQDPTKLGIDAGETLTVEDAIKALIVRSANDVAVIVAEHIGGSEYQFATKMTQKARELGMTRTTFVNASGLPDTNQRSTANDLVILSRRLIGDYSEFYPYFRLQSFVWGGRSYAGHNNLLRFFDGADGLKTGYTRMSGFNLASSATRQGTRLISIVMGGRSARERDVMTAQLLETEFTKLGLGRLAPVVIAMSPLVLDDDEAAAAEATERASESRPQPQSASSGSSGIISAANAQPAVVASLASSPREYGQGDTADQARRGIPVTGGKWGIQVGAHSSRDNAENQLQSVRTQMRDLLSGAASAVVALDVNGDTFFRVRFGAFTPKKAETLCDQIQKRGVSCLVVTDGAWDQATSRASLPIAVR
ncbi:MAG: D-alanyl-D-alanine carboxypeptidase [Alphaproteobacteria bacterium]|nr:D-alanyl-D-alanine carboxypeptidase [Alphaproteobacteria bacterium]